MDAKHVVKFKKINEKNNHFAKYNVAVVTARFNFEVTDKLKEGALDYLKQADVAQIYSVDVPGAFEVPMAVAWLLERSNVDAVVALGAVIRGETSHYDYVCNAVERGCSDLQLQSGKPVSFGILTTENEEQAMDRAGGKHGNKGAEAAQVAVEMLNLKAKIREI